MPQRWQVLVAVGIVWLSGAGCRTSSDQGGLQGLPPPPQGTPQFSDYEPEHPYLPVGDIAGVADRSVFTSDNLEGYSVQVRDILVSPALPEAKLVLGGSAVLEVRQGSGKAWAGEREIDLGPGTVFTVNPGESLRVTASGGPLAFRTWIVSLGGKP